MHIQLSTHIEDFKSSNIKYTNEVSSLETSFKSFVTLDDEVLEEAIVEALGDGAHGVGDLVGRAPLHHELGAHLDLGLAQVRVQVYTVNAEEFADDFTTLYATSTGYYFRNIYLFRLKLLYFSDKLYLAGCFATKPL